MFPREVIYPDEMLFLAQTSKGNPSSFAICISSFTVTRVTPLLGIAGDPKSSGDGYPQAQHLASHPA